jgi:hypothetical protein
MYTEDEELKFYLLAHGLCINPEAESAWLERYGGPMTLSDYASTSGICFYTGNDIWINAPFIENFTHDSQALLSHRDGCFAVERDGVTIPVSVVPVPRYHERSYHDPADGCDYPYTNLGVTHTDRCRVSPIEGCAWRCTFCDLPYEFRYRKKPIDELLEVIKLSVDDEPAARHVLVSGGTPRPEDEPWLDEVYAVLAGASPISVDVMMPARHDFSYPAWMRSVGVNMMSINLEVSDHSRALKITPNKARLLGRELYLNYIEKAVEAFSVGFVQSLMVFGEVVESLDSTLEGVRDLAERGCLPVLSPFRPDPNTPLGKRGALPPTMDQMKYVWEKTVEICQRVGGGVKPGPRCIPCHHNTVTFPDGSSFYVPLGGDLTDRAFVSE